jgi:hypothetical protein
MCCSLLFLVVAGEALDVVGVRLVSYHLYFDDGVVNGEICLC